MSAPTGNEPQPNLKQRARFGMLVLAVRSAMQQLVVLVASIFLARILAPGDYGIFGILQFAMALLKLIGETGLGASLLQRETPPNDLELSTVWWFQAAMGLLLVAASFLAAPLLPIFWPSLTDGTQWLLPAFSLSLFFTMMRVVPFLILERNVSFGWVGTLEFFGTLGYYSVALLLAHAGAGVKALVWASVGQAALVSIAANIVQPWHPRFVFSWSAVRSMMKFGAAFQGNHVLGFINGAVTPLLVGAKLGKEALGIVQFAQGTAWFPTAPVGIVRQVYFPYLSRLQSQPKAFIEEFELAVTLCALPTFFFFALFAGGGPALIPLIYGAKWSVAVPIVYVYSIGFCFNFYSWIGGAAIEALGQTGGIFRVAVIGLVTNWSCALLATWWVPTTLSFALGFCVHLIVSPLVIYVILQKLVPGLRPLPRVVPSLVAGCVAAGVGRLLLPWVGGLGTLAAWIVPVALVFAGITLTLDARLRAFTQRKLHAWLEKRRAV
jgi:O-antigen/teichoic acid export membrane protein